jgi:hypothetical protein
MAVFFGDACGNVFAAGNTKRNTVICPRPMYALPSGKDSELPADHEGLDYTVRLYRPRAEILNGKWKFPEPQAVN